MFKKCIFLIATFVVLISLAGCCGVSIFALDPVCAVKKYPFRDFYAELAEQGVQVIKTGETINIVIPSDNLFNHDSANFSPDSDQILEPLVALLAGYEVVLMRVSGFTDNSGSQKRNIALTTRQAQRVLQYLTARRVDARVVYAVGFGPYRPIATNETAEGRAKNRRIEILFRYVIIPPV